MNWGMAGRIFREKRIIVVALLVLALGNAIFYGAVVFPLQRRVASADQRAAASAAELASAEHEQKLAQDTSVGKARAEKELRRFYQDILPANQSAARRITYLRLAELARESDLRFDHRTFTVDEQRDSVLTRLDITMLLEGTYENVREFLHKLERAKEFVIISGIELVQRDRNDAALELTLRLATFYRAVDDEP